MPEITVSEIWRITVDAAMVPQFVVPEKTMDAPPLVKAVTIAPVLGLTWIAVPALPLEIVVPVPKPERFSTYHDELRVAGLSILDNRTAR